MAGMTLGACPACGFIPTAGNQGVDIRYSDGFHATEEVAITLWNESKTPEVEEQ